MQAIFDYVRKHGRWYEASAKGWYDGKPFTYEDFNAFIQKHYNEETEFELDTFFPTSITIIEDGGTTFYLRMMEGQGTVFDLMTQEHFERNFPDQAALL